MRNYIANSEVVEVKDYPYGFKLRTTLINKVEFRPKFGFRVITQTINPKTGVLNKPKNGNYHHFLMRYYDENNHIQFESFDFYGIDKAKIFFKIVYDNFSLYSADEIKYIYLVVGSLLKYAMHHKEKTEENKAEFKRLIDLLNDGRENLKNYFDCFNDWV